MATTWTVVPLDDTVHVVPSEDLGRHELNHWCWCNPTVEHVNPNTLEVYDRVLVVHRRIAAA